MYDEDGNDSDIEKNVQAFSSSQRPSRLGRNFEGLHCDFCGKKGHIEAKCFMNPAYPDNELSPKLVEAISHVNKSEISRNNGNEKKKSSGQAKVEIAASVLERTTINPPKDHRTYADSGATIHIFHSVRAFVPGSIKQCAEGCVTLADESSVNASSCGDVMLHFEEFIIQLQQVLFIPSMGYNFVSTGRLADKGVESLFRRKYILLMLESDGTIVGSGDRDLESKMYVLPFPYLNNSTALAVKNKGRCEIELWHPRLAHINLQDLKLVHKFLDGVP